MTYLQARERLLTHLRGLRWTVKPHLKVPQAITPAGNTVFFKAQAVYLNQHSLWLDIRTLSPEQFVQAVEQRERSRDPRKPRRRPVRMSDLYGLAKRAGKGASDFAPRSLAQGTRVELEHTRSRAVARQIAMDHLTEDPRYYVKLARMEGHRRDPSKDASTCFMGHDVVCLVFAQARWTKVQAKAWARAKGMRHGVILSEARCWLLPQRGRDLFIPGSFRRTHVARDVHAMVGCPR